MPVIRGCFIALVFLGMLLAAGESQAVIYKYVDGKGDVIYVDDFIKIPEPDREKAVIVTGKDELELTDDADRERALAARRAGIDGRVPVQQKREPFLARLARSGAAAAAIAAILFVIMNIDALKEKQRLVRKTRIILLSVLVLFIGFTHARDLIGLFRSVGDTVPSPLADIKEKQAVRGKRAAEAYKNIDQALQEKVQQEVDRVRMQFDEAESGR